MSGPLQSHDDGPPLARCHVCGALAAGPCARCQRPTCGDCCVLTEGGVRTWAVCTACEGRTETSLRQAWLRVLLWTLVPVLIVGALILLALARRHS